MDIDFTIPGDQISDITWRGSICLGVLYLIHALTTHTYVVEMSSRGPQNWVLSVFSFWAYPWRLILSDIAYCISVDYRYVLPNPIYLLKPMA